MSWSTCAPAVTERPCEKGAERRPQIQPEAAPRPWRHTFPGGSCYARAPMVHSPEDLEGFLNKLERRFERLEDGTFLVAGAPEQPPLALRLAPPVLVVQVEIGKVVDDGARQAQLFRKLLDLNASDLLHAAYGLEGNSILLNAALTLDTLDLNELEAVFADIDMALAEHVPVLRELVAKKA
jgi:hypothetical protein